MRPRGKIEGFQLSLQKVIKETHEKVNVNKRSRYY